MYLWRDVIVFQGGTVLVELLSANFPCDCVASRQLLTCRLA